MSVTRPYTPPAITQTHHLAEWQLRALTQGVKEWPQDLLAQMVRASEIPHTEYCRAFYRNVSAQDRQLVEDAQSALRAKVHGESTPRSR